MKNEIHANYHTRKHMSMYIRTYVSMVCSHTDNSSRRTQHQRQMVANAITSVIPAWVHIGLEQQPLYAAIFRRRPNNSPYWSTGKIFEPRIPFAQKFHRNRTYLRNGVAIDSKMTKQHIGFPFASSTCRAKPHYYLEHLKAYSVAGSSAISEVVVAAEHKKFYSFQFFAIIQHIDSIACYRCMSIEHGGKKKKKKKNEEVKSNSSSHKSRSRIFHYLEHSFWRFSLLYCTCMSCAAYVGVVCLWLCIGINTYERSQDKVVLHIRQNNQGGNVEYIYK